MTDPSWLTDAQKIFEEAVKDSPEGSIRPRLIILRDGIPRLIVIGDEARFLAAIARPAMGGIQGDELILISDAHFTRSPTNPEGKRWGRGEMQERSHEPAVKALLIEALMALYVKRGDEEAEMWARTYERDGTAVRWLGDEGPDDVTATKGLLPSLLLAAMKEPPILNAVGISEAVVGKAFNITPDKVKLHTELAAVRLIFKLAEQEHQTVACAFGARKEEGDIVKRSFESFENVEVSTLE